MRVSPTSLLRSVGLFCPFCRLSFRISVDFLFYYYQIDLLFCTFIDTHTDIHSYELHSFTCLPSYKVQPLPCPLSANKSSKLPPALAPLIPRHFVISCLRRSWFFFASCHAVFLRRKFTVALLCGNTSLCATFSLNFSCCHRLFRSDISVLSVSLRCCCLVVRRNRA